MLSFGIQFGKGFDAAAVTELMYSIPTDFDYDVVVIGSNPGGVACAKEARLAGKKTVLIKCKKFSTAESEGVDEDLGEMEKVLTIDEEGFDENSKRSGSSTTQASKKSRENPSFQTERKVRKSRLDLSNEFFKRGEQCRKLMHNAIILGDLVENAYKSGWRVTTTRPPVTVNWNKMSEEIMDFVMKENWDLATELSEQGVEVVEGFASFENNYTVNVQFPDQTETKLTSEIICIALPSESILPEDVVGAMEYGITCDDFLRLSTPPGNTLVVGSSVEAVESAGIIAGGRFPVTIVSRSKFLTDYDLDVTEMIMQELREKGVKFLEETNLKSIQRTSDTKLLASFESLAEGSEESEESKTSQKLFKELFDTVLFAVGRKLILEELNPGRTGIEVQPNTKKVMADGSSQTAVPNIYVVGEAQADCPESMEISQLSGKLLGKRLFHDETELMNYGLIPSAIYTPTEYGFVGLSEEKASFRFGQECVVVYYGYFKPLDFVIPPKLGQCFTKIIVLKQSEIVIGLHIFGPQAGEIIQGFAAAMKFGLSMKTVRTLIGITGTTAQEIIKLKEIRRSKEMEEETFEEI